MIKRDFKLFINSWIVNIKKRKVKILNLVTLALNMTQNIALTQKILKKICYFLNFMKR